MTFILMHKTEEYSKSETMKKEKKKNLQEAYYYSQRNKK